MMHASDDGCSPRTLLRWKEDQRCNYSTWQLGLDEAEVGSTANIRRFLNFVVKGIEMEVGDI